MALKVGDQVDIPPDRDLHKFGARAGVVVRTEPLGDHLRRESKRQGFGKRTLERQLNIRPGNLRIPFVIVRVTKWEPGSKGEGTPAHEEFAFLEKDLRSKEATDGVRDSR